MTRRIENIDIENEIGEGASSIVYRGRQVNFARPVAVKLLKTERASQAELDKFQREARVLARLQHQNIAQVWQFGVTLDDDRPYIVMEFVDGNSLSTLLQKRGSMDAAEMRSIFLPLCDALKYIHDEGVVHRDLKPGNILLAAGTAATAAYSPKLIDFGIAKISGVQSETTTIAGAGSAIGSPAYMSPEQCRGGKITPQSDIYSLGCIMFECVTGRPPFAKETAAETLLAHLNEKIPKQSDVSKNYRLPNGMVNCILKCLAKEPNERFASISDLRVELEAALNDWDTESAIEKVSSDSPVTEKSRIWITVAVLACITVIAYGALSLRNDKVNNVKVVQNKPKELKGKGFLALSSAGVSAQDKGNNEEALKFFDSALAKADSCSDSPALFETFRRASLSAEALARGGNRESRRWSLQKRLDLNSRLLEEIVKRKGLDNGEFGSALCKVCALHRDLGHQETADAILQKYREMAERSPDRHAELRQVNMAAIENLRAQKKYKEAIGVVENQSKGDPNLTDADVAVDLTTIIVLKARLNSQARQEKELVAKILLDKDIRMTQSDRGIILIILADCCIGTKDFDLGRAILVDNSIRQTRTDNGTQELLRLKRARVEALSGNCEKAEAELSFVQTQLAGYSRFDLDILNAEIATLKKEIDYCHNKGKL